VFTGTSRLTSGRLFWPSAQQIVDHRQVESVAIDDDETLHAGSCPPPQVKLMVAARRRPDLSLAQFRDYWLHRHGPLIVRYASVLRIQRYAQNHAIDSDASRVFGVNRELGMSFDGIAEGWWKSEADMVAAFVSPEGRLASAALADDERNFCSDDNRVIVAYEYILIS
jgi:hypothetical protein